MTFTTEIDLNSSQFPRAVRGYVLGVVGRQYRSEGMPSGEPTTDESGEMPDVSVEVEVASFGWYQPATWSNPSEGEPTELGAVTLPGMQFDLLPFLTASQERRLEAVADDYEDSVRLDYEADYGRGW